MPFARMTTLFSRASFLVLLLVLPALSAAAATLPAETDGFLAWSLTLSSDATPAAASLPAMYLANPASVPATPATTTEPATSARAHLRGLLADFAVTLRNIRYRRGGHDPATGFDCSGFVHYVFRHSLGLDLPTDSASQYRIGSAIARSDMKIGDLVFFHIRGKRISHVGIYLGEGRFIHSPSTGRTVSISSLDEAYWSRRFAGAKRPKILS